MGIILRDYQIEDLAATVAAHETHQCVLGRAPTGSGKGCLIAAAAEHYAGAGRVLILVDVGKLVRQLARTVRWVTGAMPGIEMGEDRSSDAASLGGADLVVVGTVQSQYAGAEGRERYRRFDPSQFSLLILDETETFLAPKARQVVEWYRQNPKLRVLGVSATPFRTDGTPMADLFDHVAFDRDILWGIGGGWLVPVRQAFVRVSIDFSTLKLAENGDGDKDYSDSEISERINNEQTLIELAKGIVAVAGERKTIVVCPRVSSAKAVADYLCAERDGCAKVIYGEQEEEEKEKLFAGHERGDFQFLVSVLMLCKGFDSPAVSCVVNCRKTRSKRLYAQILGRGTRPLPGVVDGPADADARKAAIAASAKPDALMVNMVGVEDSVRDITVADILGTRREGPVVERAKRLIEEDPELSTEDALDQAELFEDALREARQLEAEAAGRELEEENERRLRRAFEVKANVQIEYQDDLRSGGGVVVEPQWGIPEGQLSVLRKAKIPDADISRMTPQQLADLSRECVRRWKLKLCSYGQAKLLRRHGYSREELHEMPFERASAAIEELKSNGWHRPEPVEGQRPRAGAEREAVLA